MLPFSMLQFLMFPYSMLTALSISLCQIGTKRTLITVQQKTKMKSRKISVLIFHNFVSFNLLPRKKVNSTSQFFFLMLFSYKYENFYLGVVQKWCHAYFDSFWPLPRIVTLFYWRALIPPHGRDVIYLPNHNWLTNLIFSKFQEFVFLSNEEKM